MPIFRGEGDFNSSYYLSYHLFYIKIWLIERMCLHWTPAGQCKNIFISPGVKMHMPKQENTLTIICNVCHSNNGNYLLRIAVFFNVIHFVAQFSGSKLKKNRTSILH